jgi:hypothetical protein
MFNEQGIFVVPIEIPGRNDITNYILSAENHAGRVKWIENPIYSWTLSDLIDVDLNHSMHGAVLMYDQHTNKWKCAHTNTVLTSGKGTQINQNCIDINFDETEFTTSNNNRLQLKPISIQLGGTGKTDLVQNAVLIGQGTHSLNTSKQAPHGNFVGTSDTQSLTNKTITSSSNSITASALFSNDKHNTINIVSSKNPKPGQVLLATSETSAEWKDIPVFMFNGLGIRQYELQTLRIISLDTTARFSYHNNSLDLAIINPDYGGTGRSVLPEGQVLIGQGKHPLNVSKSAPDGDFVGTHDVQSLTHKTIMDESNMVTATYLFSNYGDQTIDIRSCSAPQPGQYLMADTCSSAKWNTVPSYTPGKGIQFHLNEIHVNLSDQFKLNGLNEIQLNLPMKIKEGGTGRTSFPFQSVLIGQGTDSIDVSKKAPLSSFVGTNDVQALTHKSMVDPSNIVHASALFSDHGKNVISIRSCSSPVRGQVLTATDSTHATWCDPIPVLKAGSGFAIQHHTLSLCTTERFYINENQCLELNLLPISHGGTGKRNLKNNTVLIGQGVSSIDDSKQAPMSDFVGTHDEQTLTHKTITDPTNVVYASALFCDQGKHSVSIQSCSSPMSCQVLTALDSTEAKWESLFDLIQGLDCIEFTDENLIQLHTSEQFYITEQGKLELNLISIQYGGTGKRNLKNNAVLIGQGISSIDDSKQAPMGDFVGTHDEQTLTHKTITDPTNVVHASALFCNQGKHSLSIMNSDCPIQGQVLTATSATTATWQTPNIIPHTLNVYKPLQINHVLQNRTDETLCIFIYPGNYDEDVMLSSISMYGMGSPCRVSKMILQSECTLQRLTLKNVIVESNCMNITFEHCIIDCLKIGHGSHVKASFVTFNKVLCEGHLNAFHCKLNDLEIHGTGSESHFYDYASVELNHSSSELLYLNERSRCTLNQSRVAPPISCINSPFPNHANRFSAVDGFYKVSFIGDIPDYNENIQLDVQADLKVLLYDYTDVTDACISKIEEHNYAYLCMREKHTIPELTRHLITDHDDPIQNGIYDHEGNRTNDFPKGLSILPQHTYFECSDPFQCYRLKGEHRIEVGRDPLYFQSETIPPQQHKIYIGHRFPFHELILNDERIHDSIEFWNGVAWEEANDIASIQTWSPLTLAKHHCYWIRIQYDRVITYVTVRLN